MVFHTVLGQFWNCYYCASSSRELSVCVIFSFFFNCAFPQLGCTSLQHCTVFFQDHFDEGDTSGVDLEALAVMLGVEKVANKNYSITTTNTIVVMNQQVTNKELKNFKRSLKKVEPREVEGFGFGKLHGN